MHDRQRLLQKLNQEGKPSPLPATRRRLGDRDLARRADGPCDLPELPRAARGGREQSFATSARRSTRRSAPARPRSATPTAAPRRRLRRADNGRLRPPRRRDHRSAGDCGYFNEGCRGGTEARQLPGELARRRRGRRNHVDAVRRKLERAPSGKAAAAAAAPLFKRPYGRAKSRASPPPPAAAGARSPTSAAIGEPVHGRRRLRQHRQTRRPPDGLGRLGRHIGGLAVVAAEFGLGGGATRVAYPAATLYSHIGESGDLYDVISGSNGSCADASSCSAARLRRPDRRRQPRRAGRVRDAGSPGRSLAAEHLGTAEQGQTLTAHGEWTDSPSTYQRALAAVQRHRRRLRARSAARRGPPTAAGERRRRDDPRAGERANASGSGHPWSRARTAAVISDAPVISCFTPSTGLTGSSITITGTAFTGATAVHIGRRQGGVHGALLDAARSDGPERRARRDGLADDAGRDRDERGQFTPSLSLHSFGPTKAAPAATVTITGLGFEKGSTVELRRRRSHQRHIRQRAETEGARCPPEPRAGRSK